MTNKKHYQMLVLQCINQLITIKHYVACRYSVLSSQPTKAVCILTFAPPCTVYSFCLGTYSLQKLFKTIIAAYE